MTRNLFAFLVVMACHSSSPLDRLEVFAGNWQCPMNHLTASEPAASRVMQEVAIEREGSRFVVRFSPDHTAPSTEAVTSVAYWSYDSGEQQFTSKATLEGDQAAGEESYSSPGPHDGKVVWTGELRSSISVAMRMTFSRTHAGLDLLVEAFTDKAWKPLSTASCTPASKPAGTTAARRPEPATRVRPQPVLVPAQQPGPPKPERVLSEQEARDLVERGAPQSPFVDEPSDRFAYKAVQATDEERRLANEASNHSQAEIDQAVELSHGTIEKSEAVDRIRKAYEDRDRALVRIFGEDRAAVLRDIQLVEGAEVPDDSDAD